MENVQKHTIVLPRVAITYCTQCRWMLRAAYYGQELLSTFGTGIGEIALIPATGGIFAVQLTYTPASPPSQGKATTEQVLIWDRKAEGGFPETKILKQRVRNHIDPDKNLGHSDTPSSKSEASPALKSASIASDAVPAEPAAHATPVQDESVRSEEFKGEQTAAKAGGSCGC